MIISSLKRKKKKMLPCKKTAFVVHNVNWLYNYLEEWNF